METIWILLIVLTTGEVIEGGQYQSEQRCYNSAQMQRAFWLGHKPSPRRMDCKVKVLWTPQRG